VKVRFVTLQAKKRLILPQEVIGHCTVRFVAGQTVLGRRRVFKDKWPLLRCVAFQAKVIHALFGAELLDRRAVHLVAGRALHLAFAQRMVRGEHHLRRLFLVAFQTKLRLRLGQRMFWWRSIFEARAHVPESLLRRGKHAARLMDAMTIRARQTVECVLAAGPVVSRVVTVAGLADAVHFAGFRFLEAENQTGVAALGMTRSRAVTCFAARLLSAELSANQASVHAPLKLSADGLVAHQARLLAQGGSGGLLRRASNVCRRQEQQDGPQQ
jgi:hypothetical protein